MMQIYKHYEQLYLRSVCAFIKLTDTRNVDKFYKKYTPNIIRALEKKPRKSNTCFIMGSGRSLTSVSGLEFSRMSSHDVIGFNEFVRQNFLKVDYYYVKGIARFGDLKRDMYMDDMISFGRYLRNQFYNYYHDCLFLLQEGPTAINAERALHYRLLPEQTLITRFQSQRGDTMSTRLPYLTHSVSGLCGSVNFAALGGWTRIVLVGVDLYDRQYFWLDQNETRDIDLIRGSSATDLHNAANGVLRVLATWRAALEPKGVTLEVYNPKSLLTRIMPVFAWDEALPVSGRSASAASGPT